MRILITTLIAVAAIGISTVAALPASGTGPGANGQIVFRRWLEPNHKTSALFVINSDGSGERQLTDPARRVADIQPDWAPDGSKIVFERDLQRGQLWTVNTDGGGLQRLSPNCLADPPKCDDRLDPAFSPDGKTIVFWRGWGPVNDKLNQIKYSELFLMDADGTHVRQLTHSTPWADDDKGGMWSPDGRRLVFERVTSAAGKPAHSTALFIVNADGTHTRQLTPWNLDGGAERPGWSPDGQWILFRTYPGNDATAPGGNLYLVRPDGSGLKQFTHFDSTQRILGGTYSPDGKWIVFSKTAVAGQPDLFVMRADGRGLRQLTRTPLWESQADWGPAQ